MSRPTFIRSLGLTDATMLVVGCIIGVGIFRTASSIASLVASPALILGLWAFGGILSLCGALCYAELAAMFPRSGGDYVYLSQTYGVFWGFLFGWTKLFIERTGTIAILAFVFSEYLGGVLGYSHSTGRWVAAGAVAALTLVNVLGVQWGKYVQNTFTAIKLAALGLIIIVGFAFSHPAVPAAALPAAPLSHPATWQALGVALVFVLWTYGGWTEATYVAEEVKDPVRNVPRAIISGVLLTTLLYVVVNAVYLRHVPVQELARTPLVAATLMQRTIGPWGATLIGWMIACSAFGALNGYILTGARILYAMGRDHLLFEKLGAIHPRFHTPAAALWLNAAVAVGLLFTKTFEQIMTYSTVVISVFFTLAVVGVIVLRVKRPDLPRPYRAWGYPVTPVIFIITMLGFIANAYLKEPREARFGFALLALGVPLYWIAKACSNRSRPRTSA